MTAREAPPQPRGAWAHLAALKRLCVMTAHGSGQSPWRCDFRQVPQPPCQSPLSPGCTDALVGVNERASYTVKLRTNLLCVSNPLPGSEDAADKGSLSPEAVYVPRTWARGSMGVSVTDTLVSRADKSLSEVAAAAPLPLLPEGPGQEKAGRWGTCPGGEQAGRGPSGSLPGAGR